jgi:hypothetical protein
MCVQLLLQYNVLRVLLAQTPSEDRGALQILNCTTERGRRAKERSKSARSFASV